MLQPSLAPPPAPVPVDRRPLPRHLPGLRRELERQRDFRIEQLAHLTTHWRDRSSSAGYGPRAHDAEASQALHEVRDLLIAGARQALTDIELALARMREGRYGRCRDCGSTIPLAVLTAVPTSTSCLDCRRRTAEQG